MDKRDLERFFIRLEELLETNRCNGRDLTALFCTILKFGI